MALAHRGIVMSKHTPGPWGIEQTDDTNWIGFMRPDGKKVELIVCTTSRDNFFKPETQEQNDANARLIAASPELLRALQAVVNDCHDLDMVPSNERGRTTTAFELAVAAIAKATGEA